jgi:hypothetical protein
MDIVCNSGPEIISTWWGKGVMGNEIPYIMFIYIALNSQQIIS